MANAYYAPDERRAARVNELFDSIAPRYDLINDLQSFGLHRYWKRRLVGLAGLRAGQKALDLCCGTGDIVLKLAASEAMIVGADFSAAMLEQAQQRILKAKSGNMLLAQADALRLPFADSQFDVVSISYGLRNLADFEGGLGEMTRVLRPGGTLLVLDFGKPGNKIWRGLYFRYLRRVVPLFGRLFLSDSEAYAYILESLEHYPAQEGVAQWMRSKRLKEVKMIQFLGGVMSINSGLKS